MRREGRQHGMVRTYRVLPSPLNPKPESRVIQQFDTPPTAGLFMKVPTKPTNHSKFTGRCGRARCLGCHMHPTCKSRDKTKGSRKLKPSEMVSSCRSITWRVVDGRPGFKASGFSASMILDHLSDDHDDDHDDIDDDGDDDDGCVANDGSKVISQALGEMEDYEDDHIEDDDVKNDGVHVHVDVDVAAADDEGWYLVGRI
ncbi:putative Calcium-binding site [Hibiscus syriacus]|uniref:Calcium-binding site n=1 Tax=Hibiscus syriacus TaxID=106335 RepID=A0A6A3BQQ4_HIBSY|nr:uncharacterized protein LOC120212798 [Hibiscus syriacus]KAE8718201.1 putative Calcium-binding site [Hibiscus syriacus]